MLIEKHSSIVTFLIDGRTCNGAIPHPTAPVFASYGIDDDVKVWGYRGPVERDGEQVQSNYVEKIVAVLEDGSLLSTMPEKRSVPVKSDTRFAFCSHGGSDDRNRYDRVSFSTAEFSHSKSSHNSLGSLPTLLKKNEVR